MFLWKVSLLTDIKNKYAFRKTKPYFFDLMKNGQIFPSKVCKLQYEDRRPPWPMKYFAFFSRYVVLNASKF